MSDLTQIATLSPFLESQPSWKSLTSLSLQDRATKWHYFRNNNPPTHPSRCISLRRPFLSDHWSDLPQILNFGLGDPTKIEDSLNEDNIHWKTTQNIKSWISLQPLISSSSNFKTKLRGPYQNKNKNKMKTTSYGRRPQNIQSISATTDWIFLGF